MRPKFIFLLLLFGLNTLLLKAQPENIRFSKYSVEEGLSGASAEFFLQDEKGFIWIATTNGLNVFDGKMFTSYRNDPEDSTSLSHNLVWCINKNKRGELLLGTRKGLNLFNINTQRFTRFMPIKGDRLSLPAADVRKIISYNEESFIIITIWGPRIFNSKTRKMSLVSHELNMHDSINSTRVYDILKADNDEYWFVFNDNKVLVHKKSSGKSQLIELPEDHVASEMYLDKQQRIWLMDENSVTVYDKRSKKDISNAFPFMDMISAHVVVDMLEDTDGNFWFASNNNGLLRVNPKGKTSIMYTYDESNRYSLSDNFLNSIFIDKQNNLWVGSYSRGLNISPLGDKNFVHVKSGIPKPYSFKDDNIAAFLQWDKNNVLVGNYDGELKQYNTLKGAYVPLDNKLQPVTNKLKGTIYAMLIDSKSRLWIATYGSKLHCLVLNSGKYQQFDEKEDDTGLPSDLCYDVFEDADKSIWIATHRGLVKYNESENTFSTVKLIYDSTGKSHKDHILAIAQTKDKTVWFGGGGGLYRYDLKTKKITLFEHQKNNPNSLSYNQIWDIYIAKDGKIWLATYGGGVNVFDPASESFKAIREKNKLPSDNTYAIVQDNTGDMWVSTDMGLACINPLSFNVKSYDLNDGLQNYVFNDKSVLKTSNGHLFFGGNSGFNIFHPQALKPNNYKPPVRLTGFQLFNKPVQIDTTLTDLSAVKKIGDAYYISQFIGGINEIKLSYKEAIFSFTFAALNYHTPEKNEYAYILEGYDTEWHYLGTRNFVSFTNLDAGNYTLKIKGSNNNGVWNETPCVLKITITPPWWKTKLFYVLCILLVIVTTIVIVKWREKKLIADKHKLENTVKERTAEVMQQNEEILTQRDEIEAQKERIEERQREIVDSINYAKRIQEAMLNANDMLTHISKEHFVFFKPKDVVSGDFYWSYSGHEHNDTANICVWVAADCTGHGVPGAFMSMIGISFLNEIVAEQKIFEPAKILSLLRLKIIKALFHKTGSTQHRDGMDLAMCVWNKDTNELHFSGANNPLYITRKSEFGTAELIKIRGDKMPIGRYTEELKDFTSNRFQLNIGDILYTFSDGYIDQFGGPEGKKFKTKQLQDLLLNIHELNMDEQYKALEYAFEEWKDYRKQVDDVLVMAVKIA